jgi:RNA polymerase sigma factor (sigma-70 family)
VERNLIRGEYRQMASETLGTALHELKRLFAEGVATGLSDAQLLDRFLTERDGTAFEVLMERHGPMVLRVCRGVLRNPSDAEDAFQAVFLILVKKARALRGRENLGGWLHVVAYRVAIQANAAAARRRVQERKAGEMAARTSSYDPVMPDEFLPVLHQEIARLPEKIRLAIVLCDLQGISQDQAAESLRLSLSTLRRRLTAGRERLKARLGRRGLVGGETSMTALLLREAGTVIPPAWRETAVRTALATLNRTVATGVVSAAAEELTREVLGIMLLQKLALASATLLAAGLLAWGASAALVQIREEAPRTTAANPDSPRRKVETVAPQPGPNSPETPGKVVLRGRVLGPDSQPIPGAKLFATVAHGYRREPFPPNEQATTGPDGRFAFSVPREKSGEDKPVVAAMAANFGVGWLEVPADGRSDDLTLRLVRDQPITGQIIDLEGRPVPGATVRLLEITANLLVQEEESESPRRHKTDLAPDGINLSRLGLKVMSDSKGQFRLTGVCENRLLRAQLDGPLLASQYLHVATGHDNAFKIGHDSSVLMGPGKSVMVKFKDHSEPITYYGANFRYIATPTKPVVGAVRDKDTGKPLAGVTVESNKLANSSVPGNNIVHIVTDAEGRYRLTGLPKGQGNRIRLVPRDDQPYLSINALVPDSPGLDPVTVDFELKRGIWIEGKLTDKATGKPVPDGYVAYYAMAGNAHVRDYPGFDGTNAPTRGVRTKQDGSFRLVGLPGPGLIAVFYTGRHLTVPDRDDEYGSKEPVLDTSPRPLGLLINYTALARIDPAQDVESVRRDVTLDPGWTFTGTVLGPDDKPLVGARYFGLSDRDGPYNTTKTAEFTVKAFNPRRPRDVFFQHPEKGLVGVARPPKENGGSIIVKMQPGATITGRLVDTEGHPRAGVELQVVFRSNEGLAWSGYDSHERIKTDQEGRFRIEALVPGYAFRLIADRRNLLLGDGLRSGQTTDLGYVKMKGQEP